jgi:hypothetical protein
MGSIDQGKVLGRCLSDLANRRKEEWVKYNCLAVLGGLFLWRFLFYLWDPISSSLCYFGQSSRRRTFQAKMLLRNLLQAALLSCTAVQDVSARALAGKPQHFIQPYKRGEPLQDIVTWDEHSLLIRGERVMLFSGEFHPVSTHQIPEPKKTSTHNLTNNSKPVPPSSPSTLARRLPKDQSPRLQYRLLLHALGAPRRQTRQFHSRRRLRFREILRSRCRSWNLPHRSPRPVHQRRSVRWRVPRLAPACSWNAED